MAPEAEEGGVSLSLANAIRAAQAAETVLAEMNLPRWATTFGCSVEDIRSEWERAKWERTQQPTNSYDVEGK
jgi:hypothetical protein